MSIEKQPAFSGVAIERVRVIVQEITDIINQENALLVDNSMGDSNASSLQATIYNRIINSLDPNVNFYLNNNRSITVVVDGNNQISWSIQ